MTRSALFAMVFASENCVRYFKRCDSRLVMDRIVVPCVVSDGNQTGELGTTESWQQGEERIEKKKRVI